MAIEPGAEAEIVELMREYASAWASRKLERIAAMWDDHPGTSLTYVSEELGDVLLERDQIVDHLVRAQHRLSSPRVSIGDVHLSALSPDLVLATFLCRWDLEWTSYSRVTAVFRRAPEDWKFVHYMESPFHLEDWDRVDVL